MDHTIVNNPSTNPLRPITSNNTSSPRLTATAGTRLVGAHQLSNNTILNNLWTLQSINLHIVLPTVSKLPSSLQRHWIKLALSVQYPPLLPLMGPDTITVPAWLNILSD